MVSNTACVASLPPTMFVEHGSDMVEMMWGPRKKAMPRPTKERRVWNGDRKTRCGGTCEDVLIPNDEGMGPLQSMVRLGVAKMPCKKGVAGKNRDDERR